MSAPPTAGPGPDHSGRAALWSDLAAWSAHPVLVDQAARRRIELHIDGCDDPALLLSVCQRVLASIAGPDDALNKLPLLCRGHQRLALALRAVRRRPGSAHVAVSQQLVTLLVEARQHQLAAEVLEQAIAGNGRAQVDHHARLVLLQARVAWSAGEPLERDAEPGALPAPWQRAHADLRHLAERHYLIADQDLAGEVLAAYGLTCLRCGELVEGKRHLFAALRRFCRSGEHRARLLERIAGVYGRSGFPGLLLDGGVARGARAEFVVQWLLYRSARALPRVGRWLVARVLPAYLHLRYRSAISASVRRQPGARHARGLLVTRAQGGIGDLLMIAGALDALRRGRNPPQPLVVAVAARHRPLFEHLPGIEVRDIEAEVLPVGDYGTWVDLTSCPAARLESRTAPRVRESRIDIFARAVTGRRSPSGLPAYVVTDAEREQATLLLAQRGLAGVPLLGVQLRSADGYKNYPHMPELVTALASRWHLLVFDDREAQLPPHPRVHAVTGLPLRQAFALADRCRALLAPDSAFVHLAAALAKPCIALFGPTDGSVFARSYPTVTVLDARRDFRCLPCWRNQETPCALTGSHDSVCLRALPVASVVEAMAAKMGEPGAGAPGRPASAGCRRPDNQPIRPASAAC